MGGKGKPLGNLKSRTWSGRMTRKRGQNSDSFVLIDVDSDSLNNIIIVDVPESLKKKVQGGSVRMNDRQCISRPVICIDDDEDSENNHAEMGVEGDGDFFTDASSSGRFPPFSNQNQNSVDAVGAENLPPFKLSKCKRTYSGKASSRNCTGSGPELDIGSAGNRSPDCEFMEDSFGKLRELWEKASMKKKSDVVNGQSGTRDEATGLHTGTQEKTAVENPMEQNTEPQVCPSSSNVRCEEDKSFPFVETRDGNLKSTLNNTKKVSSHYGLRSTQKAQFSNGKAVNPDRESDPVVPPLDNAEGKTSKHVNNGSSNFHHEKDNSFQGPSSYSGPKHGSKQMYNPNNFSQGKEKTAPAKSCTSDPETTVGRTEASLPKEEVSVRAQHFVDAEVYQGRDNFQKPICKTSFPDGTMENFCERPSLENFGVEKEKGCCQNVVKPITEEPTLCSIPANEVRTELNMGPRELSGEFMLNHQQKEEKDVPLGAEDGDATREVQSSLIDEREKLKETDEYKRAAEEEWASRQRELKLQAEEAQLLRRVQKRKRAESMRLLDMERRQKERVEEMRQIQKKDEENMNLKEKLRAEIRKELNKLEISCKNMASLLHGLGIQVGSGSQPLPHEVRTAYKRALLCFHPDRASGSDPRQLVEAEEKFKLISRMKEKFLM